MNYFREKPSLRFLLVVLFVSNCDHAFSQTKLRCADMAAAVHQEILRSSALLSAFRSNRYAENLGEYPAPPTQGPALDAAKRVDLTQQKIMPFVRDYQNSLEDFEYALRVCAR